MGRRGRSKQILDTEERRGYWKLKKEALDLTVWRNSFGRPCRKTDYGRNERIPNYVWEQAAAKSRRKTYVGLFPKGDRTQFPKFVL
jgi:hypothetical protein